jgi:hypothetical protein
MEMGDESATKMIDVDDSISNLWQITNVKWWSDVCCNRTDQKGYNAIDIGQSEDDQHV